MSGFDPRLLSPAKKKVGIKCEVKIIKGCDNTGRCSAYQLSKAMDREWMFFLQEKTEIK